MTRVRSINAFAAKAMENFTYKLVFAAATDAGNRSMRKAGRSKWNAEDFNVAAAEFNRLWPQGLPLFGGERQGGLFER